MNTYNCIRFCLFKHCFHWLIHFRGIFFAVVHVYQHFTCTAINKSQILIFRATSMFQHFFSSVPYTSIDSRVIRNFINFSSIRRRFYYLFINNSIRISILRLAFLFLCIVTLFLMPALAFPDRFIFGVPLLCCSALVQIIKPCFVFFGIFPRGSTTAAMRIVGAEANRLATPNVATPRAGSRIPEAQRSFKLWTANLSLSLGVPKGPFSFAKENGPFDSPPARCRDRSSPFGLQNLRALESAQKKEHPAGAPSFHSPKSRTTLSQRSWSVS